MMKTVSVSRRINVPAQAAWEVIRSGGAMDRWVPAITSCKLEGEGIGARRICVINGQELIESVETVDDASRLFQYRILQQSLMPVHNVLGTIHVSSAGPAEAEVLWFVNFELEDEAALPVVKAEIEGIYRAGIEGLEVRVRAT
jgi:Polyketide cyclase / dehydrase and lipid transport